MSGSSRTIVSLAWMSALLILVACGSEGSEAPDDVADLLEASEPLDVDTVASDTDANDALDSEVEPLPPLITRVEAGEPLDTAEILSVTEDYLELLRETRYFGVTDERVHGWPRSDAQGRYWYGTWWSGVQVVKEGGAVTYRHSEDGADNNGMRSAPILTSVCFAEALWGNQEPLLRKLVRGFNSWGMAMERVDMSDDDGALYDTGVLLARSHYPESITSTDDGREIAIDYSQNRPGVDLDEEKPPSIYVHNPDNPHWGDIYVKNKRSKDDIGHMFQAFAFLPACAASPSPELATDLEGLASLYRAWSQRVEDDDWRIATIDEDWEVYWPFEDLAFFIQEQGVECKAMLATRLYGRGDPGSLDCGDGITVLSEQWAVKNDFHQIQRSFHEAAAALAQHAGQDEIARALLQGLAWRLDRIFDAREDDTAGGDPYAGPHEQDLAELVVMAANVGVPLTWREVRFLHARIREAHSGYLSEGMKPLYHVFDADTPDGDYAYNPGAGGFFWRYLGAPLGLCASPYVRGRSAMALDCARIRAEVVSP
jgi:hypothetical protein